MQNGLRICLRFILLTVLLLQAAAATAGWIKVGEVEEGTAIVYIDPALVRRNGERAQLWVLRDFSSMRSVGRDHAQSVKEQWETDCKDYQARMLEFFWMSERMGAGSVVLTNRDGGNWRRVVPRTVVETLWNAACTNKKAG